MTDLESRLNAALRADAPPERDAVFRLDVLVRRERARFRRELTLTVAAALGVAILGAMNAHALGAWVGADAGRLVIVAVLAAAAVAALPGTPFAALPGVRTFVQRVERWFFV
jgi:hypothetical protein